MTPDATYPERPLGDSQTIVLTDHPWRDLELERRMFEAAGFDLVAGPEAAGTASEIETLINRNDPVAIITCWGEVSAAAIASPSKLEIVARLGVGLDNIAVGAATARGAWVTNVPDYCTGEVSDHAIGLMLAHYRGIVRLDAAVKAEGWKSMADGLQRISDLTVGLVGYGRIGRETGRKLAAFGCTILGVSNGLIAPMDVAEQVDLPSLQERADVIILHAPLSAETHHMINRAFLSGCKRKPLIVNVSRGPLVDNLALAEALDEGWIRGATLDVVEGEPAPPAELTGRPDVIVTPHVAYASGASMIELRRRTCEEVVRALRGEPLHHACNQPLIGEPLDGGVASDIRVIDGSDGKVVVKRALAKLRVEANWYSDPTRSSTEVAAINAFADLVGSDAVPEVLWVDPRENTFAMRLIDGRLRNWKQDLLSGTVDLNTAGRVGQLLGQAHARSAVRSDMRERFDDLTFFDELRIQPFFRSVADRRPEYREAIFGVIDGMAARRTALVHGDYSPKNILAAGREVIILDFEVAHWGDPRFDLAFVICHLMLKAFLGRPSRDLLLKAIDALAAGYAEEGPSIFDPALGTVIGCLLLARIIGTSPVDYIADLPFAKVEHAAKLMLEADDQTPLVFIRSILEQD